MSNTHHRGSYPALSSALNATSNADPDTRCWRDGLRLDQHPPRNGKPARWTTGHIDTGTDLRTIRSLTYIDGQPCAPEANTHNYRAGGATARTSSWFDK